MLNIKIQDPFLHVQCKRRLTYVTSHGCTRKTLSQNLLCAFVLTQWRTNVPVHHAQTNVKRSETAERWTSATVQCWNAVSSECVFRLSSADEVTLATAVQNFLAIFENRQNLVGISKCFLRKWFSACGVRASGGTSSTSWSYVKKGNVR